MSGERVPERRSCHFSFLGMAFALISAVTFVRYEVRIAFVLAHGVPREWDHDGSRVESASVDSTPDDPVHFLKDFHLEGIIVPVLDGSRGGRIPPHLLRLGEVVAKLVSEHLNVVHVIFPI